MKPQDPMEQTPLAEDRAEPGPIPEPRFCIEDHIVNPGDGAGMWYLYDLYDHNDGPPCAEFYEREKAMELLALLTDAAAAESRERALRERLERAAEKLAWMSENSGGSLKAHVDAVLAEIQEESDR